jgi:hypothetical protein
MWAARKVVVWVVVMVETLAAPMVVRLVLQRVES